MVGACHGTIPYDTADLEMREWAKFAEEKGIIVVAPRLESSKGDFPPGREEQIERQRTDERRILAIVRETVQMYNVASERIFITGWSAASYPIFQTGLNHPDIFRAIFVRQGSFEERFMDPSQDAMDRWQPIKIVYGRNDFLRDQTRASIKWLREQAMFVVEEEISGIHRRIDPGTAWKFFEEVARERPWIQVRAENVVGAEPLTVQFELDAIPKAVRQKWYFGDQSESREAAPTHVYSAPGRYRVTVNVEVEGGKVYMRPKIVRVARVFGESK